MKKIFFYFLTICFLIDFSHAEEGMWIPILLKKYNIEQMREMGFQLSAEDIYDINNSSMKDAVVIFGGGCTGEVVSDQGLLFTNYHCGYRRIQSHSSVENDYLTKGFWAMDRKEELPNPELTVKFLEYMEDVTEKVLKGTDTLKNEKERSAAINENIAAIQKKASKDEKFYAKVKPLFYGNQYFLYLYKVFKDIRLVGAPPSAIGKFGGDTDNWVWPRHTGDFAVFRIYANKDNEPAEYSEDNIPYRPKKFFKISTKGVNEGDFTLVYGFPARTMEYIPSQEVEIILNQRNPDRIKIRDEKLKIIANSMKNNPKVRIQYAAKQYRISNAWKKWKGEIMGLKRLDAVNKKLDFENEFKDWAVKTGKWKNEYAPVFQNFKNIYADYAKYIKTDDYYSEIILSGIEIFSISSHFTPLINSIENGKKEETVILRKELLKELPRFFKDYHQPTDKKLFATLMPVLINQLDAKFIPASLPEKINPEIFKKTVFTDQQKLTYLLKFGNDRQILKLKKDPMFILIHNLTYHYSEYIRKNVQELEKEINRNMKKYMAGIMEMKKEKALYPDANSTLRVSYGKVNGFYPKDGVQYNYSTTLKGVIQKDNPKIYDYNVPEKLIDLYENKDYGNYAVSGEIPVCFIASNHTTGGNSGSPVLNARGELIGLNFDRAWEGVMSDIFYDPQKCRNIVLDIRFILFIIDKFAGAGYLLDEMELVGE